MRDLHYFGPFTFIEINRAAFAATRLNEARSCQYQMRLSFIMPTPDSCAVQRMWYRPINACGTRRPETLRRRGATFSALFILGIQYRPYLAQCAYQWLAFFVRSHSDAQELLDARFLEMADKDFSVAKHFIKP